MSFILWATLLSGRTVIELDDLIVEGEIRRPRVIQLEASQLSEKLEKAAVYNLIKLEERLLEPLSPQAFQDLQK